MEVAQRLLKQQFSDVSFSKIYQTPSLLEGQQDYLNAVARVDSDLDISEIHEILKEIEQELGKDVMYRWGPRTIDLDILLWDDEIIEEPNLTIPHPRMHERRFVLEPLCDVCDPKNKHPILGKTWEELLAKV